MIIDNRTGLPDEQVRQAVMSYWTETAAFQFGQVPPYQFHTYPMRKPSMLARMPFHTPRNVIEEVKLAREFVDHDDDVQASIGQMIAIAFGEGMENYHSDDRTMNLFNRIAADMNLDLALKPPQWLLGPHVLGTDAVGRDILSRLFYGARVSLEDGVPRFADVAP